MPVKLSDIRKLVGGEISAPKFLERNAAPLAERRRILAQKERGRVIPVRVDEDEDLEIAATDLVTLCRIFIDGAITDLELEYLADVLQLSDRVSFADSKIRDHLDELTDPEINGPLTVARAQAILAAVGHA